MQVCTLLQTDNHASTPPLSFFTGRMPFLPPSQQRQSVKALKAYIMIQQSLKRDKKYYKKTFAASGWTSVYNEDKEITDNMAVIRITNREIKYYKKNGASTDDTIWCIQIVMDSQLKQKNGKTKDEN